MKVTVWWMALLSMAAGYSHAWAWEHYPGIHSVGEMGVVEGDFDGDGFVEIAISGTAATSVYGFRSSLATVLGRDSATGGVRVRSITPTLALISGKLVKVPVSEGPDQMAVALRSEEEGQILIMGGVPLRPLRVLEAPYVVGVEAVADVDADGDLEIVALTSMQPWPMCYDACTPTILDFETGTIEWVGPQGVLGVAVAQLDADPAQELLFAGTPGRIVDGKTHANEWTYVGGFGGNVLPGRFGPAGAPGFATVDGGRVQIFRTDPFSPTSEFVTDPGFGRVVRLPPDETDLILMAPGQSSVSRAIRIHDPATGAVRWSFEIDEIVGSVGMADIDGDGHVELVFGAGLWTSWEDTLHVVDMTSMQHDFLQEEDTGPYSALAVGRLLPSGEEDVAFLVPERGSALHGMTLRVLDASTGMQIRTAFEPHGEDWGREYNDVATMQADADPQKELVLAGNRFIGEIFVLDSQAMEMQWHLYGSESPIGRRFIRGLGVIDVNDDAVDDVVITLRQDAGSISAVLVLDGSNGNAIWESVALPGGWTQLAVHRAVDQTPRAIVSAGRGLYSFDLSSHLLVANVEAPLDIQYLHQWGEGDACRVVALDWNAHAYVYRCVDLALLDEHDLPQGTTFFRPLDAGPTRYLVAVGQHLYEADTEGNAIPVAGPLGEFLGSDNKGVVRPGSDTQHFDVIIGSDYMVTRITVGLDAMFADGFD